jgi:myosin-crossreactive antigen
LCRATEKCGKPIKIKFELSSKGVKELIDLCLTKEEKLNNITIKDFH